MSAFGGQTDLTAGPSEGARIATNGHALYARPTSAFESQSNDFDELLRRKNDLFLIYVSFMILKWKQPIYHQSRLAMGCQKFEQSIPIFGC